MTESPTTESPTTESPTTESPMTESPTTESPTTESPTTESPTTESRTTESPTTLESPPTESPTYEPTEEIIDIDVTGGNFAPPYYDFTIGGNSIEVSTFQFFRGRRYKFSKPDNDHPFFVSDRGVLAESTFTIKSQSTFQTGINAGRSLEFQLPSDFEGDLTYYCVPHNTTMVGAFNISST
jgi:hypothetical protein